MSIGERIRQLRKERNITQEELSEYLGVTKATVQKYENGQIRNLRAETIKKLSELFGVGPVFFVFDDVPDYLSGQMDKLLITHYGAWFEDFLENISRMNEDGKKLVRTYVEDIASIDRYRLEKYKSIRRKVEPSQ